MKHSKQVFLAEGPEQHQREARELEHLARIKEQKLAKLRRMGVPDKYMAELTQFDPKKALITDYKRGGKW